MAPRTLLAAVALLSAAVLAYELLLLRLFAIIQWHHFASLAISVALLGMGAAGTFVTLARRVLLAAWPASFILAGAGFAVAAPTSFVLAQRIPFNALEILWDPKQFLLLALVYLLLFLPFFLAATALCVAYARFGEDSPRLYGADILGAGVGCLGLLGLLFLVPPNGVLPIIAALALAAAGLAAWRPNRWPGALLLAAGALLPGLLPIAALELKPSEYKDLSQALQVKGAHLVAERWSPLGWVAAVDSPLAPLRHAPGLSLNAMAGPPPQLGLFVDGQAAGVINRYAGDADALDYLADTTVALPYRLLDRPRVLVLGAGGGGDVLGALALGARTVDAVEMDRQLVNLVQEDLAGVSGRPYSLPRVRLHLAEARGFAEWNRDHYDLVQLSLLDGFGGSASGLAALAENHLYTVEALDAFLSRLAPGGMLAVTRWLVLPPKDPLRLFATAIAALERRGVADPGRRLAMVRSWNTATLLVKERDFSADELAALRTFCRERAFDLVHLPGIAADEANRHHLLLPDDLHMGTQALLGPDREDFIRRYKFDLRPTSDDRPYHFQFFRWHSLPDFLKLRAGGALPPLDWGYPVLLMALTQATLISLVLILLPLGFGAPRRALADAPRSLRRRLPLYFLALGLGFMAIEIPLLQRFSLFLSHPLYGAATVLAAFLVSAGLGARQSARWQPAPRWPFAAIAGLTLTYAAALPALLGSLMGLGEIAKLLVTIGLVAPLGYCLGMPFPLGLSAIAQRAGALLPWAWGINGFASVAATLLATLLAIHWGQTAVLILAAALYGVAASCFPDSS
jgi:hypothetical protein